MGAVSQSGLYPGSYRLTLSLMADFWCVACNEIRFASQKRGTVFLMELVPLGPTSFFLNRTDVMARTMPSTGRVQATFDRKMF